MIYYKGDIHGQKFEIVRFCKRYNLSAKDTIVLLGDVGANHYGNKRDKDLKEAFQSLIRVDGTVYTAGERIMATRTKERGLV